MGDVGYAEQRGPLGVQDFPYLAHEGTGVDDVLEDVGRQYDIESRADLGWNAFIEVGLKKASVRSMTPSNSFTSTPMTSCPICRSRSESRPLEHPRSSILLGGRYCRSFEIRPCELSSLGLSWYSS